jgi:hypothetical protein
VQIEFVDYSLNRIDYKNNNTINCYTLNRNSNNLLLSEGKKSNYFIFDSNVNIKVCLINRNKIYKQFK